MSSPYEKERIEAIRIFNLIHQNAELMDLEMEGFKRGAIKGKTMDVPFNTIMHSLGKQFSDLFKALVLEDRALIKRCFADIRNVAGCAFLKFQEIEDKEIDLSIDGILDIKKESQ